MSKTMTVYIPTTGDSTSQSQSKVVTIANLKSVDGLTVNTGSVSHTVSGNDITINVSGGAAVRTTSSQASRPESTYLTNGSNSFPSSVGYNDGVYSGTLYPNGLSYVLSGSYTPADSYTKTRTISIRVYQDWGYDGDSWVKKGGTYCYPTNPIQHTENGYTGPLYLQDFSGTPPTKTGSGIFGQTATTWTDSGTATYSGTITRPASDTRTWRQDYSGTVYGPTSATSYYAYVVTLTYTDSVKLGTVNYKTPTGIISLPVYDLTMADPILRIKLPNAIGCFELVPIGDVRASNVRIHTQKGLKAIAKT